MESTHGTPGYGTPPQHDQQSGSPPPNVSASEYAPVQNGRKRKADGTSSRGVANLTPEQLAKKRANDREAQRAIRERTKNQIESLERRIKELESQQPFQELQNVVRARDAIQAENDDLKRRMQTIFALLQPVATPQGLNDLAAATAQQSPLPMPPPPGYMQPQSSAPHQELSFAQQHLHPDLRNAHSSSAHSSPAQTAQQSLQHARANGSPVAANRHQHDSRRWETNSYSTQPPPAPAHDSNPTQPEDYLLGSNQRVMANGASPQAREERMREIMPTENGQSLFARLPVSVKPTCPLDKLLLDFQVDRRQKAERGVPSSTLVGPAYPSISSLLNPARAAKSHPLSMVFTDILGRFSTISCLPEQVAVLYIMFLIMRWHVAPTQENFDRLPSWARPVKSQLEIAHPAWIDHLPWPMMRDRLTSTTGKDLLSVDFETFSLPYTTTLSLNWPYEPLQCLLPTVNNPTYEANTNGSTRPTPSNAIESALHGNPDDGEEFIINPVFESHLRNLDNWSLGPAFKKAFPELVEDVRMKES